MYLHLIKNCLELLEDKLVIGWNFDGRIRDDLYLSLIDYFSKTRLVNCLHRIIVTLVIKA